MTLSLDDVRNKRFRMARKSGYEVLEVDEFVDEVEETFGQLVEENQSLKKQVEALKAAPGVSAPGAQGAPTTAPQNRSTPAAAPAPQGEQIVVTTSKEASTAVVRLVEMSTDQSERLVAEASAEANQIRQAAEQSAQQMTAEARGRAEKVETEARAHADRLQTDATQRSEALNHEIGERRREMFGTLEKQREELSSTVTALRSFESTYRSNLTGHLQSQIEVLSSGSAEPADPPAVLSAPATGSAGQQQRAEGSAEAGTGNAAQSNGTPPQSDTPRLDALLGDQR